ncbi:MAG: glycoside hydrolase family 27 protein, partial [Bacteroidetes bacterium]
YDWCNTGDLNAKEAYITMRDALKTAGRPIVFSICEWGQNEPWKWGKDIGHLWRVSGDITPCWDCEQGHGSWFSLGVWKIINLRKGIRSASGPGHWNDFDMMEVGNGMTAAEDRVHFAMWAMLASPLIMGNDLRSASTTTLEILTNEEVIAVNQDSLGIQAFRFYKEGNLDIWAKPLSNEEWAFCFVNLGEQELKLDFNWKKEPIEDGLYKRYLKVRENSFTIRDLYRKADIGHTGSNLQATIAQHDCLLIKLRKTN